MTTCAYYVLYTESFIYILKNGFVKEVEYENVLGKQFLFARLVSGDTNADN